MRCETLITLAAALLLSGTSVEAQYYDSIDSLAERDVGGMPSDFWPRRTRFRDVTQIQQQRRAADRQQRIVGQFEGATRFSKGLSPSQDDRRDFLVLFSKADITGEIQRTLNSQLPRDGRTHFKPLADSLIHQVLQPDGSLRLNAVQYCAAGQAELQPAVDRLITTWALIHRRFKNDQGPQTAELKAFAAAVQKLRAQVEAMSIRSGADVTRANAKANTEMDRLDVFARKLFEVEYSDRLRMVSASFPGGTVQELITSIDRHPVAPRPGTVSQQVLSALVDRIIRQHAARHGFDSVPEVVAPEVKLLREYDYLLEPELKMTTDAKPCGEGDATIPLAKNRVLR